MLDKANEVLTKSLSFVSKLGVFNWRQKPTSEKNENQSFWNFVQHFEAWSPLFLQMK